MVDDVEADAELAPSRPALVPGVASAISPLVRRIMVPDPEAPDGVATATWLVGIDEVAVIDPGPDRADHVESIVGASMRERVRWVLATDDRPDLWGAAARMTAETAAVALAPLGRPGRALVDGQVVEGSEFGVQVIAAPGPAPHHAVYLVEEERALVCGSLLGGSGSTLHDVAALRETIVRIQRMRLRLTRMLPVGGHVVEPAAPALAARLEELDAVDAAIAARLGSGPARVDELVEALADQLTDPDPARAAKVVLAHLHGLRAAGRVAGRDARSIWKAT